MWALTHPGSEDSNLNFSAEYGRNAGASVNITTRGGSNSHHGSVFEFVRNDDLDARNYFSRR